MKKSNPTNSEELDGVIGEIVNDVLLCVSADTPSKEIKSNLGLE